MTKLKDGIQTDVDWLDDVKWTPECQHCSFFEHNHCDNPNADHYGHMLMPFHYACELFKEY